MKTKIKQIFTRKKKAINEIKKIVKKKIVKKEKRGIVFLSKNKKNKLYNVELEYQDLQYEYKNVEIICECDDGFVSMVLEDGSKIVSKYDILSIKEVKEILIVAKD